MRTSLSVETDLPLPLISALLSSQGSFHRASAPLVNSDLTIKAEAGVRPVLKFDTDARENSTIHQGASFKSKAKWEGNVLKVTTTRTNGVEMERYSMQPDGTLMLVIDRPDHRTLTLYFQRQ